MTECCTLHTDDYTRNDVISLPNLFRSVMGTLLMALSSIPRSIITIAHSSDFMNINKLLISSQCLLLRMRLLLFSCAEQEYQAFQFFLCA